MVAVNAKFEPVMLKSPCPELVRELLKMLSSYLVMIPFAIAGVCHVTVMDVGPVTEDTMLLGSPGTAGIITTSFNNNVCVCTGHKLTILISSCCL